MYIVLFKAKLNNEIPFTGTDFLYIYENKKIS
jgi:hypothetical protein